MAKRPKPKLARACRLVGRFQYHFGRIEGGTVARAGSNTCTPLSAHVGSLGHVLINRPAVSAFGQTGH
jgi:hypothetical protein